MFERFTSFLKESRHELQHVTWPTRKETTRMVFIVIGVSLVVAAFLGAADFLLIYILRNVIGG